MSKSIDLSTELCLKLAAKAVSTSVLLNAVALFTAILIKWGDKLINGAIPHTEMPTSIMLFLAGCVFSWAGICTAYFSELFYVNAAAYGAPDMKVKARKFTAATAVVLIASMIFFACGVVYLSTGA